MNDKRGKKLMIACFCIFISVVLLVTSFLHKKKISEEGNDQKEQILKTEEYEPDEYEPEVYQESGEPIVIYFTNTSQIDEKGALPFKEIERLTEKTQEFLHSQGNENEELRVIDGSLKKAENITYFSCKVGTSVLEIGFDSNTDKFDFVFKEGVE